MYKQHFGLSGNLFGDGIAKEADVYCGPRQKLLAANLTIALARRDTIAAIYGAPGTGKTTIASHALREMTTRLAVACIGHPPVTGHELLELLLTEFGFSPYKNSRTERLQTWRQFLNEMSATDTRVCVLIENAEDLNVEVLKALEKLTAVDANGCPGCNVLLTATAPSEALLNDPELAGLRQRIRLQSTLPPLTVAETREYLSFKARSAGAEYETLFAPDTSHAVHAVSGGIIRVINNTLDSALSIAATRSEPRLSANLVRRVAVSLFGIPNVGPGESEQRADEAAKPTASAVEKPATEQIAVDERNSAVTQPPKPADSTGPVQDQANEIASALEELTQEPTPAATPGHIPVVQVQAAPIVLQEPMPAQQAQTAPKKAVATQVPQAAVQASDAPEIPEAAVMAQPLAPTEPVVTGELSPAEKPASPLVTGESTQADALPEAAPKVADTLQRMPDPDGNDAALAAATADEVNAFLALDAGENIPTLCELVEFSENPSTLR